MHYAIRSVSISASWKLQSLCRAQRFYTVRDLVGLFKSHILSYIEYRTPAILHCATSVLEPLDHILDRFLRQIGMFYFDALIRFNLTPFQARRDMAALAIIYRVVLGKGPKQLRDLL